MRIVHLIHGFLSRIASNKAFSGCKIPTHFYAGLALPIPEMLPQLQLPYDREYEVAKGMVG